MRTRYRTPVLAALLPIVLLGAGCNLVKAKAAFKDGNRLYKEENYRKAILEYDKAVSLKPNFAEAHYQLGNALFDSGKREDALAHYELAVRIKPNFTDARDALDRLRAAQ